MLDGLAHHDRITLETTDREVISPALEDSLDDLLGLCATLLQEHTWRLREGF